jgi:hypothetical protein
MSKAKENVKKALHEYQQAAEAVIAAVRKAYPIGSVVTVTIGRSTFEARISAHKGCWWSCPGDMYGRNLNTGKLRTFSPRDIQEPSHDR